MSRPIRVAFTLEQCWHDVPGGTATSALAVARRLVASDAVEPIFVAGRHRRPPSADLALPGPVRRLPLARPWLYETWNRWARPRVELVAPEIDVCHSTTAIPAATSAPHVVTIHDIAFVHTPERFTGRGVRVMRAGLERCRTAEIVAVPSETTRRDLLAIGFDEHRLRVVPWGVEQIAVTPEQIDHVRSRYSLPAEFVLFVGTLEPRKNLVRLVDAVRANGDGRPLVVAGPSGWGEVADPGADVRLLGFVPDVDLAALYASATVCAYPSLEEGFGMPVAEAMAQGTPVVTSRGTATEEVAGGAAVLVDPTNVDSIAAGLVRAHRERDALAAAGRRRAAALSWDATAAATVAAYRDAIAAARERQA